MANKETPPPPPPQAGRRRLPARHAPPRWFVAGAGAQERLVGIGARATRGERARCAAQLRELSTPSPVPSQTAAATYRLGSWQPLSRQTCVAVPGLSGGPGAGREAQAPYLGCLPVRFLIGATRSRLDIGCLSETGGQAQGQRNPFLCPIANTVPIT